MELLIDIYLYIYITHAYTHKQWQCWTEDDRSCDAGDRDSLLGSRKRGKDGRWREWMREKCEWDDFSAPSHSPRQLPVSLHPPVPPHAPLTPRDAHSLGIWGRTHSNLRECLCMWTCEAAEQSWSVKQTDMHVRLPWIQHPGNLCFFFSLTLTFLLFFITVIFSFYLSILVLSTKIILSVVLFLFPSLTVFSSFFLLTLTLSICLFHSIFLLPSSTCLLWLWEKLELKSSNLAVNGVVLSKIVLYIKNDFLKKKMTLLWIKYLTVVECRTNCNMNECLIVCLFLSVHVWVGLCYATAICHVDAIICCFFVFWIASISCDSKSMQHVVTTLDKLVMPLFIGF